MVLMYPDESGGGEASVRVIGNVNGNAVRNGGNLVGSTWDVHIKIDD
jgi:hypothetical protein